MVNDRGKARVCFEDGRLQAFYRGIFYHGLEGLGRERLEAARKRSNWGGEDPRRQEGYRTHMEQCLVFPVP